MTKIEQKNFINSICHFINEKFYCYCNKFFTSEDILEYFCYVTKTQNPDKGLQDVISKILEELDHLEFVSKYYNDYQSIRLISPKDLTFVNEMLRTEENSNLNTI